MDIGSDNDRQWFEALCERTDHHLWRSYRHDVNPANLENGTAVLFPRSKGRVVRVSEQEARFAFAIELAKDNQPRPFVPEDPTKLKYRFCRRGTGANGTSAQTDLAIYDRDGERGLRNMEFKSGGYSPSRKNKEDIRKDCVKLLCEPRDGAWFHVFEKVDNRTITGMLKVLAKALREFQDPEALREYLAPQEKLPKRHQKEIAFHFVVLKQGFSFRRLLENPWVDDPETFFKPIHYTVTRETLTDFDLESGWTLHREQ